MDQDPLRNLAKTLNLTPLRFNHTGKREAERDCTEEEREREVSSTHRA